MKTIKFLDVLQLKNPLFIDVRSPGEYKEATIPGAINIPLFTDEERAKIGHVYKHNDPQQARELGLSYIAPKLVQIVQSFREIIDGKTPIVFCWRGGERSKNICNLLEMMKIYVYRLEGGYKAYRNYILQQFADYQLPPLAIVLHGYTGSGKTKILHQLTKLGQPILDLEALAGHRGSAFGSIGLEDVHNQKQFDALLYNALEELQEQPYFFMEAESKRIGRVNMPDFLFQKKESGLPILVRVSLEVRVQRILAEYVGLEVNQRFLRASHKALSAIEKKLISRIGKIGYQDLEASLRKGDLSSVITVLLDEYYDPLYQHSQDQYDYACVVDGNDLEEAVFKITRFTKDHFSQESKKTISSTK